MTLAPPAAFTPRIVTPYSPYDASRVVGKMTPEEYWALEQSSPEKHEYRDGVVLRMATASPEHNLICANSITGFNVAFQTTDMDCSVYTSDQKIYVSEKKYYLADLVVVCGDGQFDHYNRLRNPFLIVEVLSPSTEKDDRTDKFHEYQTIESLRHYILVEQNRPFVTHYAKQENGLWAIAGFYRELNDLLAVTVDGKTATVPLATIYRRVSFPTPDDIAPGA